MNKPLEIEYKFLIAFPDIALIQAQPEYKAEEMYQVYLELPKDMDENGTHCRIRCVKSDFEKKYIKTFKESLSDMTRIEVETEISEEEFNSLLSFRRKGYNPIHKQRHSFKLYGFTYEIDIFPFWQDRAYLEIEVEAENIKPPIPEFINIIKDVTTDKRYRNTALAQNIITDEI